jgi:hypothetical protein
LRRNGVAIEGIAQLLGHSIKQLRMTLRYAHTDMDRLHRAVASLVQTDTKPYTGAIVEFANSMAV